MRAGYGGVGCHVHGIPLPGLNARRYSGVVIVAIIRPGTVAFIRRILGPKHLKQYYTYVYY